MKNAIRICFSIRQIHANWTRRCCGMRFSKTHLRFWAENPYADANALGLNYCTDISHFKAVPNALAQASLVDHGQAMSETVDNSK